MNLQDYLQQTTKEEVKYWINHNLRNYLEKESENVGEIEHIIDYFNSDKAPTRLKKMSYEEAKSNAEKWVRALVKKGNDIVETEEDVETILTFNKGFRLVKLKSENSFKREGSLMGHCVASYYNKNDISIFSLRDPQNNPHCTMEVTKGENVNQIKGKGNGEIHPKYIDAVIKSLEYFGMTVRDSEMRNLGYESLESDLWELLDKNFEGIKYISFNGKRYFYNKSKLIRIAA